MKEEKELSRRQFLHYMIGAVGAFIGGALAVALGGFAISPALEKKESEWTQIGPFATFKKDEPALAEFTSFRKDGWVEEPVKRSVWVVRRGEADFLVFNTKCTHLGCAVSWHPGDKTFKSPCHGGVFDIEGKVTAGPPPRPLDTLEWRVEGGNLSIVYQDFQLGVPQKEVL